MDLPGAQRGEGCLLERWRRDAPPPVVRVFDITRAEPDLESVDAGL